MKYYVESGDLRKIVTATNPINACSKALSLASGETIGEYFYVDERGFRKPKLAETVFENCTITTDDVADNILAYKDIVRE